VRHQAKLMKKRQNETRRLLGYHKKKNEQEKIESE
jgi:hypothetical protein